MKIVQDKIPSTEIAILGNGILKEKMDRKINDLQLRNIIKFDFESNPATLLSKSLVYASLQRDDNYHK